MIKVKDDIVANVCGGGTVCVRLMTLVNVVMCEVKVSMYVTGVGGDVLDS